MLVECSEYVLPGEGICISWCCCMDLDLGVVCQCS